MSSFSITEVRLRWLQHLAKNGPTSWSRMPRKAGGQSISNQTWRPMVDAGLISAEYRSPNFSQPKDWWFAITEVGTAAIAKAKP